MDRDCLDLVCLSALKVNAESDRVAICAASIIVHAHAIAREAPASRGDAMRIVDLARHFYAVMPSRDVVGAMVDDCLAEIAGGTAGRSATAKARDRLVDGLWLHFHRGTAPPRA